MPNLSTTLTKVLEICNDPFSSPNDLNKVIALDPVLTGQVLNLINSAYCGFPGKTVSLTRAIIVLGLNTVKNLALATSLLATFKAANTLRGKIVDAFWEHSLRVGVISKVVAKMIQIPGNEQEEYFVAGLLHDLGKLPLMACFPEEYHQADGYIVKQQVCSCEAEKHFLKLDHCHVNRFIAGKWNLGTAISNALVYHHISFKGQVGAEPLLCSVSFADQIAHHFQSGSNEMAAFDSGQVELLRKLKLFEPETLLTMQPEIEEQIETARIFLKISGKG
ncbi:MAG: HDOD domain-containing protein [Desulfobacterales bacterium]